MHPRRRFTQSVGCSLEGCLCRGLGGNTQTTQIGPTLPRRLHTAPCPSCAVEQCCPLPTRPALLPKASQPPWALRREQDTSTSLVLFQVFLHSYRLGWWP